LFLDGLWDSIGAALDAVPLWILVALVLIAGAIEATPILGIIIPANSLVFIVGLHWANLGRWPVDLVLAYALGSYIGDIVFFAAGRHFGLAFMEKWPGMLRLSPERRAALEKLVDVHGGKAVIIARFQPVTRSFAPYVAGAARLSAPRFLSAAAIASVGMALVVVSSGFLTGLGLAAVGKAIGWGASAVVAAVVLVLLGIVWLKRRQKKEPTNVSDVAK